MDGRRSTIPFCRGSNVFCGDTDTAKVEQMAEAAASMMRRRRAEMRWWRIKKRNADLERELQSDLELEEAEQREHGLSSEEAHYAALRAFGNPALIREHTRAVWSWNWLENLLRDLRISIRTLLRSPGFSFIAVLVMALCIGAATSLFTVVRSVLLKPPPFRDPERLVMIYEHFRDPSMNA